MSLDYKIPAKPRITINGVVEMSKDVKISWDGRFRFSARFNIFGPRVKIYTVDLVDGDTQKIVESKHINKDVRLDAFDSLLVTWDFKVTDLVATDDITIQDCR